VPSEDRTFENVSGAPEKALLTNSKYFFDFQAGYANILLTKKGNIILARALKPRS
jgi:hypothetical protein